MSGGTNDDVALLFCQVNVCLKGYLKLKYLLSCLLCLSIGSQDEMGDTKKSGQIYQQTIEPAGSSLSLASSKMELGGTWWYIFITRISLLSFQYMRMHSPVSN